VNGKTGRDKTGHCWQRAATFHRDDKGKATSLIS